MNNDVNKIIIGGGYTPEPRKWNLYNLVENLLEMEKSIGPEEIHDAVIEFDESQQKFQVYIPGKS